jgi:hypothetical protein
MSQDNIAEAIVREDYESQRALIRLLVRTRDDQQDIRLRSDGRLCRKADGSDTKGAVELLKQMSAEQRETVLAVSDKMRENEELCEAQLVAALEGTPLWRNFYKHEKGIGPVGAGWIIGELDFYKADTLSKIWQYCGCNPSLVRGKRLMTPAEARRLPEGWVELARFPAKAGKGPKVLVMTDTMIPGDRRTTGFLSPYNGKLRTALHVVVSVLLRGGMRWIPCTQEEYDELPENYRAMRPKKKGKVAEEECGDEEVGDEEEAAVMAADDDELVPYKLHIKNKYAQLYVDHKWRLRNSEKEVREFGVGGKVRMVMWKDARPGHINLAAQRYVIKMLILKDAYEHGRASLGLPVRAPFAEEKLGLKHCA